MKRLLMILMTLFLLCGCTPQMQDYTLASVPTELSYPTEYIAPQETRPYLEYATYPVEHPSPNVWGNMVFSTRSKIVHYYDMELRRQVALCSQPNCTHNTEDCTAYLGGSGSTTYQVVGDLAYALIQENPDDGGKTQFIAQNVVTGERNLLWDLTPEKDNTTLDYLDFIIDGEAAFIQFRQYDMEETVTDGVFHWEDTNIIWYIYEINLATGERTVLSADEVPNADYTLWYGDCLALRATTEDYLLIIDYEPPAEDLLSYEDFYEKYPEGDLSAYVFEHQQDYAYVSINRKTGERKRICGNAQEARIQDSNVYRDQKMSFVNDGWVCVYDGRTGEVTRYFEQESIGFQNLLDGRIIYNVWNHEESDSYEFYWYDLTTGEKQQFQKGVALMIFSIRGETEDCFIGLYKGIEKRITKQDFYNENYDAAF